MVVRLRPCLSRGRAVSAGAVWRRCRSGRCSSAGRARHSHRHGRTGRSTRRPRAAMEGSACQSPRARETYVVAVELPLFVAAAEERDRAGDGIAASAADCPRRWRLFRGRRRDRPQGRNTNRRNASEGRDRRRDRYRAHRGGGPDRRPEEERRRRRHSVRRRALRASASAGSVRSSRASTSARCCSSTAVRRA